MPAPQSQITSLLAWLAVSVFLLAGAPAQRQAAGSAGIRHRCALAGDLAKTFATHDFDRAQIADQIPLPQTKDAFDAPSSARCPTRAFLRSRDCGQRRVPAATVPRLTLVGLMELRL
jgi:hypothetical protein